MNSNLPVLYSFRRCPYAIRARMTLFYAGIAVEIREVDLKNKPAHLLEISPKGTVPVLQLANGEVLEESLVIMSWVLNQTDPEHWLSFSNAADDLIKRNDGEFKYYLDRYKYADRYPENTQEYYRQKASEFLFILNERLANSRYLCGQQISIADVAIFPFIRQFASVDMEWWQHSSFKVVNNWLQGFIDSELFIRVMKQQK
ncbi:MAG: glutathione S-transferase [Methylococcales bacterium]|nr:glutathione S-transferase [Methylococcales bacterium]